MKLPQRDLVKHSTSALLPIVNRQHLQNTVYTSLMLGATLLGLTWRLIALCSEYSTVQCVGCINTPQ